MSTMDREMSTLLVEMQSEKITLRQKAFKKMLQILQQRKEAFLVYMNSDDFETEWSTLFNAVYHGMFKQSCSSGARVQGKNNDYAMVLKLVVELAMAEESQKLTFGELISAFVRALADRSMREIFGEYFCQMQKLVLSSKWSLTSVSYTDWKDILHSCFAMLETMQEPDQTTVSCLALAVVKFLDNCSMRTLLVDYLTQMLDLLEKTKNKQKIHDDLMLISCIIVEATIVDSRTQAAMFLESLLPHIVQNHKERNMSKEQKSTLFRLMHLSLIVFYPGGISLAKSEPLIKDGCYTITDEGALTKTLREYHYILTCELKAHQRENEAIRKEIPFCDGFIDFAARLCYTIYWNEENWQEKSSGETAPKMSKRFNKLQSIIEMVGTEPVDYNWRWLVILSTVLDNYGAALSGLDYHRLLQLLCSIQSMLQTPTQQHAFYRCCSVLLEFEQKPAFRPVAVSFNSEFVQLWSKIITAALRGCTTTGSNMSNELHRLLQLLIKHRKYPNISFLNSTVLEAFYTYAIAKTNDNVGTILAILETLGNVECLGDVRAVLEKLFDYLYPQSRELQLKQTLHAKERLSAKMLAQISILCVVTKHTSDGVEKKEVIHNLSITENKCLYIEQDKHMRTIEQTLLQHSVDELMQLEEYQAADRLESTPKVTYNLNEPLFVRLCEVMNFDKHTLPESNSRPTGRLDFLCSDVELYVEMLNTLLIHQAYNEKQCRKSPLYKKIQFQFQQLNLGFEDLLDNERSLNWTEIKSIAERLLAIFRGPYHAAVKQLLQETDHRNVLQWVLAQIDLNASADSACVTLLHDEQLSSEQHLKRCFLHIAAEYLQYDGPCTSDVHELLDRLELNVCSSLDLFYKLDMCRIMLRHPSNETTAVWVQRQYVEVCKHHNSSTAITELIIDLYADFTSFVSPYEGMVRNATVILHSFIKLCAKHTYSTKLQVKIFAQIKYLLRAYPQYIEMHESIYMGLISLLKSDNYRLKLEAVRNILYFMQPKWVYKENSLIPAAFYEFQSKLYEEAQFDELITTANGKDDQINVISACLQLLLGVFNESCMLRRRALRDFVLIGHAGKINRGKIMTTVRLATAASGVDLTQLLRTDIDAVLVLWFSKGYRLMEFPYLLDGATDTIDKFIQLYKRHIAFVILCMQPDRFEQFCSSVGVQQADIIKSILSKCVSFLLPKYAKCDGLTPKYNSMANRIHKALEHTLKSIDLKAHVPEIIKHLTYRLNESNGLGKLVEQAFPKCFVDELSISSANYALALEHLKQLAWDSPNIKYTLLSNLCLKNSSSVERTLMAVKRSLWDTVELQRKMIHLLQHTVVLEQVKEYLSQQKERSFKPYLVRDVIYFLCNLLGTDPALRLATLNSLARFVEHIVTCEDAEEMLSDHLNFIVSSLLAVECVDPFSNIANKALALLRYLIVQHSDKFASAIASLNYMPNDERFEDLRLMIMQLKTVHRSSSSEIVSLIEQRNLRCEDLAALNILLTTKKEELQKLCDEVVAQKMSSTVHNDESVLHRLINMLLEVVRNSPLDKRSLEALRCLGEIGPIDLGAMLLRTDAGTIAYGTISDSKEAIAACANALLGELDVLLTNKNVSIQYNSSQACYKLLHGRTFHALAAKLPTLHPFLGNSSEEVNLFTYTAGCTPSLRRLLENDHIYYRVFVEHISASLLCFLGNTSLKKLTEEAPTFAEKIIPLLVQITIKLFVEPVNTEVSAFVNGFFQKFNMSAKSAQNLFNDPKAVQLMLRIVESIRIHNQLFPQFKVSLNYLPIAKASQYCQAHFKAILYGELWYRDEVEKGNGEAKRHPELFGIMKSSHLSIGVNDAVQFFLDPILERTEYYRLQQNYEKCLIFEDISINVGIDQYGQFTEALKNSFLYGFARSLSSNRQQLDYECAWRLADWNVLIDEDKSSDTMDESLARNGISFQSQRFERAHYKALKCLELRDELAVEDAILEGRRAVGEIFKLTSIESTKHIYHSLCRLRLLQQIEDFGAIHFLKQLDCEQDLLAKWARQDELPYSEFMPMERILSQRLSIFSTGSVRAKRQWIPSALHGTLLLLIHESRLNGYDECALRNIARAGRLELPANIKSVVMLEDAQLNWSSGHTQLAHDMAREVMDSNKYNDPMVNAVACRVYGEFQAEGHLHEVKSLCTDYFQQAEKCVKFALSKQSANPKATDTALPLKHRCFEADRNYIVLHTVAKYADREFVRLSKLLCSQEREARRINLARMEEEAANLKIEASRATDQRRKDIARSLHFTQKNLQRDKKAAEELEQAQRDYLRLALCYYLLYAKQTTIESDMVIFRIISLWLNNQDNESIRALIEESLPTIPSYKFIAVLPQLTPRVSTEGNIGALVQKTLIRCALDHPHHTLPYVFAQLHAFKDQPEHEVLTNDNRLMGARKVYDKLRKEPTLSNIIQQMQRMNLALIELANKPITSSQSFREYTMTKRDLLGQLENLDEIHCPTLELPVVMNAQYRDRIVGIRRWDLKVTGVGGINVPKKLLCHCLDGKRQTQLLKGKDDMRQDAVMQQVFGILNILLHHDKETSHRKLSVRTYKVVPLSRQSGILEWCNNTMPIGHWLVSGHTKYRPQDIDPTAARKKFMNNAQPGMTVDKKLQNYREICRKLQPVLRHYFLENYHSPGVWFERQQNYTKSVAASSMIGYVLGIGDRHVQNILIDKHTGEVIHIDFGIAFNMGKNLPTPETIPFRLTRDLVDGMGISGVEGVFKKSCEKTLEVLRNNQTVIQTILEVLLYDPLYSWNVLSNKKANRRQQHAIMLEEDDECQEQMNLPSADINVTAERTLMQVVEKLQGKEDDKYISVEGQVQLLIFNATNERNLCQLFVGWQPYL